MAVYGINYDEGNKKDLGYESVRISYGDGINEMKVFNSGNFVKDWFDLVKFIITELSKTEPFFIGSSSVDHFFMDGADELYDEAYLITGTTGESELFYSNVSHYEINFYVPKSTQPTWEELKEMCK